MTDIPISFDPTVATVPSQLGTLADLVDGELHGTWTSAPELLTEGYVRAAAMVMLVDVVVGLALDTDPDAWMFTSELSVRLPAEPVPDVLYGRAQLLRAGRRSSTSALPITRADGSEFGFGVATFARVPRREGDNEKPPVDAGSVRKLWERVPPLRVPVREAAGIQVIDAATGTAEIAVRREVVNPAGTLQGAMVALLAEVAAEELATAASGIRHIVTDLDIRFLRQIRSGAVRSRARFIGDPRAGSIIVDLFDTAADNSLLTTITARTQPIPRPE